MEGIEGIPIIDVYKGVKIVYPDGSEIEIEKPMIILTLADMQKWAVNSDFSDLN